MRDHGTPGKGGDGRTAQLFGYGDEGGIGIGAVNAAAGEDERCPGSSNCFLDGRGMSAPWAFRGWFGADLVSPVWLIVVPETSKWIGPGRPAHISRMSMRTICGMRVQAWPKRDFATRVSEIPSSPPPHRSGVACLVGSCSRCRWAQAVVGAKAASRAGSGARRGQISLDVAAEDDDVPVLGAGTHTD